MWRLVVDTILLDRSSGLSLEHFDPADSNQWAVERARSVIVDPNGHGGLIPTDTTVGARAHGLPTDSLGGASRLVVELIRSCRAGSAAPRFASGSSSAEGARSSAVARESFRGATLLPGS